MQRQRLKREQPALFSEIAQLLCQHDPIHICHPDVNPDEYEPEVGAIVGGLPRPKVKHTSMGSSRTVRALARDDLEDMSPSTLRLHKTSSIWCRAVVNAFLEDAAPDLEENDVWAQKAVVASSFVARRLELPMNERFRDTGESIGTFTDHLLVVCPRCSRCASITALPDATPSDSPHPAGSLVRRAVTPARCDAVNRDDCENAVIHSPAGGSNVASGHTLWAYNLDQPAFSAMSSVRISEKVSKVIQHWPSNRAGSRQEPSTVLPASRFGSSSPEELNRTCPTRSQDESSRARTSARRHDLAPDQPHDRRKCVDALDGHRDRRELDVCDALLAEAAQCGCDLLRGTGEGWQARRVEGAGDAGAVGEIDEDGDGALQCGWVAASGGAGGVDRVTEWRVAVGAGAGAVPGVGEARGDVQHARAG